MARTALAGYARCWADKLEGRVRQPTDDGETEFLNVDLEVFSRESLASFAKALGPSVHVLHEGRWGRRHAACVELWSSGYGQTADSIIRRMSRLLTKMPRSAKVLWNRAQVRQFNIGIEAAARSRTFEVHVSPDTLHAAARLGARLVVTVYSPERLPGSQKAHSRGRRSRPTRG
jgi:hypothetical protein